MKTLLLNDDSPMPFGKYKGVTMANVPAEYLLWYDSTELSALAGDRMKEYDRGVRAYIEDNREILLDECANKNGQIRVKVKFQFV